MSDATETKQGGDDDATFQEAELTRRMNEATLKVSIFQEAELARRMNEATLKKRILFAAFLVLALVFIIAVPSLFLMATAPLAQQTSSRYALYIATEKTVIRGAWKWNEAHQQAMLHSFTNAVLVSVRDDKYYCHKSCVFYDTPATGQLLSRHNCDVVMLTGDCTRPVWSEAPPVLSPPGKDILQ